MSEHSVEVGYNSHVEIVGNLVVKTSIHPFPNRGQAEGLASRLSAYAGSLQAEPLRTAALYDVSVLGADDGYRISHTYELVEGPSLSRASQKQATLKGTLAQIADMKTLDDEGTLATPFDAKADNFHVNQQGEAVLIDMIPVLVRNTDGSFPLHEVHAKGRGRFSKFPWQWGTQIGAMTGILSTSVDRGEGTFSIARHIAGTVDDWCYDALPENLQPGARDQLRREIGAHFLPYLLRTARHKLGDVIGV